MYEHIMKRKVIPLSQKGKKKIEEIHKGGSKLSWYIVSLNSDGLVEIATEAKDIISNADVSWFDIKDCFECCYSIHNGYSYDKCVPCTPSHSNFRYSKKQPLWTNEEEIIDFKKFLKKFHISFKKGS